MPSFLWENFFRKKSPSYDHFLKEQPLFSALTLRELRILKRVLHERAYFPGEVIFKSGSSIGFYMILSGEVHIFYGDSQKEEKNLVNRLKQGDFFGEMALVQDQVYQKNFG